ncbi:Uncharacterised protein [Bordetella pertussis]|nr:Uncharacterised protein [Bordetella pertussis]CPM52420.1 Uncharacterised protein [Bordetella pertussis]CPN14469.1 Uncharacterised protein [Bordetella pertussis]CPO03042.1 Uncharacterised protein [Bordetella pertussis]
MWCRSTGRTASSSSRALCNNAADRRRHARRRVSQPLDPMDQGFFLFARIAISGWPRGAFGSEKGRCDTIRKHLPMVGWAMPIGDLVVCLCMEMLSRVLSFSQVCRSFLINGMLIHVGVRKTSPSLCSSIENRIACASAGACIAFRLLGAIAGVGGSPRWRVRARYARRPPGPLARARTTCANGWPRPAERRPRSRRRGSRQRPRAWQASAR